MATKWFQYKFQSGMTAQLWKWFKLIIWLAKSIQSASFLYRIEKLRWNLFMTLAKSNKQTQCWYHKLISLWLDVANHVTSLNQTVLYFSKASVITLYQNESLWFYFLSHVTSLNQSECFILAYHDYVYAKIFLWLRLLHDDGGDGVSVVSIIFIAIRDVKCLWQRK